jgi:hypothetical protein
MLSLFCPGNHASNRHATYDMSLSALFIGTTCSCSSIVIVLYIALPLALASTVKVCLDFLSHFSLCVEHARCMLHQTGMQHLAYQCTLLPMSLLLACTPKLSASSEHLFLLLPIASAAFCSLLPCGGRHSWHGPHPSLMSNPAAAILSHARSRPDSTDFAIYSTIPCA